VNSYPRAHRHSLRRRASAAIALLSLMVAVAVPATARAFARSPAESSYSGAAPSSRPGRRSVRIGAVLIVAFNATELRPRAKEVRVRAGALLSPMGRRPLQRAPLLEGLRGE